MNRIYHPWHKWECYKSGFYEINPPPGLTRNDCLMMYADFLRDIDSFELNMKRVKDNWIHSCEHFLTNESMNRIAWLGQSAMCINSGISSFFRSGFFILSESEQKDANFAAEKFLLDWIESHEKSEAVYKTMGISRLF